MRQKTLFIFVIATVTGLVIGVGTSNLVWGEELNKEELNKLSKEITEKINKQYDEMYSNMINNYEDHIKNLLNITQSVQTGVAFP